jgi:hypothetical protein
MTLAGTRWQVKAPAAKDFGSANCSAGTICALTYQVKQRTQTKDGSACVTARVKRQEQVPGFKAHPGWQRRY